MLTHTHTHCADRMYNYIVCPFRARLWSAYTVAVEGVLGEKRDWVSATPHLASSFTLAFTG